MALGWTDRDEAVAAELASVARARLYRRPIALAGFMGVGKSTLGHLLAELLERPFFDTDSEVEKRAGRTVSSFFPDEEAEFRRLEAETVADLLSLGPTVIALGGGALLNQRSLERLRAGSLLVHLHVPWADLRDHIPALVASRPLLRGRTLPEIHQLYVARLQTYRQASLRVTVGRGGPEGAAAVVLGALRSLEGADATRAEDDPSQAQTRRILRALLHARAAADGEVSL